MVKEVPEQNVFVRCNFLIHFDVFTGPFATEDWRLFVAH